MANHASALKRARQNIKRNARNRALRSTLRSTLKKFRTLAAGTDKKAAAAELSAAHATIDKMVTKGVLHKNAAARHKSRLAKSIAG